MKKLSTLIIVSCLTSAALLAQSITLETDQDPMVLKVGETKKLNIVAIDQQGNIVENGNFQYQLLRQDGFVPTSGALIDSLGNVSGQAPGSYNLIAFWIGADQQGFARRYINIQVEHLQTSKIEIVDFPENIYSGTSVPLNIRVLDQSGAEIMHPKLTIETSDPTIGRLDGLSNFYAETPGMGNITITSGGISSSIPFKVLKNPVERLVIDAPTTKARTGDVISFRAMAYDKTGKNTEVPVLFTVSSKLYEAGAGASAIINEAGKFVAEKPGTYTVIATCGNVSTSAMMEIVPRNVERDIKFVGQGSVNNKHTSDLWVWEGIDGRDYCVTGTWGADGFAYFWDVTDPSNLQRIDSIQVDARTVNDVKVSEDGTVCIISREGASNRRNGIVILDVKDPHDVKVISTFDDQLTGGVHNLFIYQGHVYALSNGQRYDVINIEDPANPYRVGKFQLDNPARAIHDVWIEDGIAYSSNWSDGVVMVDVGNGVAGGSPENPIEIARSKVQGDANHAAFPYKSEDTGKFYVIAGDEIFPLTFSPGTVTIPSGYLHFIDFTDLNNPKEVARYELPEAGSHNLWVEDDILYVAYYNGGLRVIDISGELIGDLYKQGREIAHYLPLDPNGYLPNAAMTWGPQPHKGHIFFSDHNSGLWSVKLSGEAPEGTQLETK